MLGKWEQERREFFIERDIKEGEEETLEYEAKEGKDRQRQKKKR